MAPWPRSLVVLGLWCCLTAAHPCLAQDGGDGGGGAGPTPEPTTQPAEEPASPEPAAPEAPPRTPAELERLARQFLGGSIEARDRLRLAGVTAVPVLRGLVDENSRAELQTFVTLVARDALAESLEREPGLVYRGQFQACSTLGAEGVLAFLAIFRDEDQEPAARTRAAIALGDIAPGSGAEETLALVLHEIIDDFLSEPWFEQEAGYLLVRLGDRSYVNPLITRLEKVVDQPTVTTRVGELLDAHTELAEVHYRSGTYDRAIDHYMKKAGLLEGLLERVIEDVRPGVVADIALLHYNMACSQSLAGHFDAARASLERALTHEQVDLSMVAQDGDLRGLRGTPGHAEWVERMRARKDAAPEPPKPAPKPPTPAE